jgi:hypothetical protein
MDKFGMLPEELPKFDLDHAALLERDRIVTKTGRLLTVAAVYLAAEREKMAGQSIQVDREHVLDAAKFLFVPKGKFRISWLNDLVDSLLFQSCFLSHSTQDKSFCQRLYQDLREEGVACWYFPEDAAWGQSVWGEINRGIQLYDRLLVICSKNSLTSGPVLREIERALQREDDERRQSGKDRQILFPITIDDYVYKDWQHERSQDVRSKVIGDFRRCLRRGPRYQTALRTLLRCLQDEEPR